MMMTTESSSLVGRRSPALVAGFFFVANVRFWPKADPENWSFAVVKASALEKSGHSLWARQACLEFA